MRANSVIARFFGGIFACLCFSVVALGQLPSGTVSKIVVKSAVLGEDRTILVRTPAGYETNKQLYPVLYMTDGDAHIGHTGSTIEFLTQNGRISDCLLYTSDA